MTEEGFVIVKQKVYVQIDWRKKRLNKKKLRQANEYLYIDLESNVYICVDNNGRGIPYRAGEFFEILIWYNRKRIHGSIGYITLQMKENLARKSS